MPFVGLVGGDEVCFWCCEGEGVPGGKERLRRSRNIIVKSLAVFVVGFVVVLGCLRRQVEE